MQYSAPLDALSAKRAAEAQKYRLQVRLSLVRQRAERTTQAELRRRADALRAEVDAVEVRDDEIRTEAATRALGALTARVRALQGEAGIPEHGLPIFPRWLEFTLWTAPVVLLIAGLAGVFALRRRKAEVDSAKLAALDAAGDD